MQSDREIYSIGITHVLLILPQNYVKWGDRYRISDPNLDILRLKVLTITMLKYKDSEVAIAPNGSCVITWGAGHPTMAGQKQDMHLPEGIKEHLVAVNQYVMQYVDLITEPACQDK